MKINSLGCIIISGIILATSANAAEVSRKDSCSQKVISDYLEAQAIACAVQRIATNPNVNQEIQSLLGRCMGREPQVLKPLGALKPVAPVEPLELANPDLIDKRCGHTDCL